MTLSDTHCISSMHFIWRYFCVFSLFVSLFLSLSYFSLFLLSLYFFFLSAFLDLYYHTFPSFCLLFLSLCLSFIVSPIWFVSLIFFTVGNFHPDLRVISLEEMATKFYWVREGGRYSPSDVSSDVTRVAILIPFRKREEHLQILMNNLHPFLYKQQLDYTVYVVDQVFTKRVGNPSFD